MNNYIKAALIFVGGAAVGGSVGWFVTKRHYEKKVEDEVKKELDANVKWAKWFNDEKDEEIKRLNDIIKGYETDRSGETDLSDDYGEQKSRPRTLANSYTEEMNRRKSDLLHPDRLKYDTAMSTRVSDIFKPIKHEKEPEEEMEVDEVLLRQNDDDPRTDIYVISAEQFAHERHSFDKVTLYWWELERILSEEDMSILDVPDILGYNWESKIGTEEVDVVYVRNENLESDYEVIVQHESYYAMRG